MFKWASHEDGSKDPLCILRVRIGIKKSMINPNLCIHYACSMYICDIYGETCLTCFYWINVCEWMQSNLCIGYVNWLMC